MDVMPILLMELEASSFKFFVNLYAIYGNAILYAIWNNFYMQQYAMDMPFYM